MNVWIMILLAILPRVLKWIMDLLSKGKTMTPAQAARFNKVVWFLKEVQTAAVSAGCAAGGTPPDSEQDDGEDVWKETA